MAEKRPIETGVPTGVREDALKFDGTKFNLRDYAADEVQAFQRPREGFVPVIEGLIDILPKWEDRLRVKGVDAVSLGKKLDRFQELSAAGTRAEKIFEMVRETRLATCDELMNDVYRVYRIAMAIGKDDPEVRGAFDFLREWLSTGPRPAKTPTQPVSGNADR